MSFITTLNKNKILTVTWSCSSSGQLLPAGPQLQVKLTPHRSRTRPRLPAAPGLGSNQTLMFALQTGPKPHLQFSAEVQLLTLFEPWCEGLHSEHWIDPPLWSHAWVEIIFRVRFWRNTSQVLFFLTSPPLLSGQSSSAGGGHIWSDTVWAFSRLAPLGFVFVQCKIYNNAAFFHCFAPILRASMSSSTLFSVRYLTKEWISVRLGLPAWPPDRPLRHLKSCSGLNTECTFRTYYLLCSGRSGHRCSRWNKINTSHTVTRWHKQPSLPDSGSLSSTLTSRHIGSLTCLHLPGRLGIQPKEQLRFGDNLHLLAEKIKMIFVTLA